MNNFKIGDKVKLRDGTTGRVGDIKNQYPNDSEFWLVGKPGAAGQLYGYYHYSKLEIVAEEHCYSGECGSCRDTGCSKSSGGTTTARSEKPPACSYECDKQLENSGWNHLPTCPYKLWKDDERRGKGYLV